MHLTLQRRKLERAALDSRRGRSHARELGPVRPEDVPSLQAARAAAELAAIELAMRAAHWDAKRAARILGVGKSTLYRALERIAALEPEQVAQAREALLQPPAPPPRPPATPPRRPSPF